MPWDEDLDAWDLALKPKGMRWATYKDWDQHVAPGISPPLAAVIRATGDGIVVRADIRQVVDGMEEIGELGSSERDLSDHQAFDGR